MTEFRGDDAALYPCSLKIVKTCYNCEYTNNGTLKKCLKFGFKWDVLWVCDFHKDADDD